MDKIADISHQYYDNNLRGGEGHMEVGKLIQNVVHQKANMTLSIEPFGRMPSSAVSDGAVNADSRVQMQLFKAGQVAQKEVESALERMGLSFEEFRNKVRPMKKYRNALHKSPQRGACTSLGLVYEFAAR